MDTALLTWLNTTHSKFTQLPGYKKQLLFARLTLPVFIGSLTLLVTFCLLLNTVPHVQAAGRVTNGLYVLYTFKEGSGSTVLDVSGVGTPLNLTINNPNNVTWTTDGLAVDSAVLIQSSTAATKVITNCMAANEITLEAWVTPATLTPGGQLPKHIITLSQDQNNRNFALGQYGNANYGARLRTTNTTANGLPDFLSPANSLTTTQTHVVYTRNITGTEKLYLNNTVVATGTRTGNFGNWDAGYQLALANELNLNRAWLGQYHLIAVYCRALTFAEINQNFTAGLTLSPILTIVKSAQQPAPWQPGDVITYTIVVFNNGNSSATGAVISDSEPPNTTFVPNSITLDPPGAGNKGSTPPTLADNLTIGIGQQITATYAVTVNPALTRNTVIVNIASVSSTQTPVPNLTGVGHLVVVPSPITLEKTGPISAPVGQTATYTFTIEHSAVSSGTPISNVTVSDSIAGPAILVSGDSNSNNALDPSETWVYTAGYTITLFDVSPLINTGIVTGLAGSNTVTATDTHSTTITGFNPALFIDKDGPITANAGETVVYTFTVINLNPSSITLFGLADINAANTGDGSPIRNVVVTDTVAGTATLAYKLGGDNDSILERTEAWVYTAGYTIKTTDSTPLVNIATVRGTDSEGDTISATDTHQTSLTGVSAPPIFLPVIFKN